MTYNMKLDKTLYGAIKKKIYNTVENPLPKIFKSEYLKIRVSLSGHHLISYNWSLPCQAQLNSTTSYSKNYECPL